MTFKGSDLEYNLLDFWQWSVSDVLSNATRGRFAEFVVGTAIGISPENLRDEWDAFDLTSENGIKIEIKSAAFIQSWYQKKYSTISFSIRPARHWSAETNKLSDKPKRHADVYVFCLLNHTEQTTIDPLKMEQWEFYVVPTYKLDNYKRSQSSIKLNSLRKICESIEYIELKTEIEKADNLQKGYIGR